MSTGEKKTLAEDLAVLVSIADGECPRNADEDLLHAVTIRCLDELMLRLEIDAIHANAQV